MKKSIAYSVLTLCVVTLIAVVGSKVYLAAEQAKATAESIEVLSDAATGAVEKVDVSGVIDVVEDKIDRINMSTVNDKIEEIKINIDLKDLFDDEKE